MTSIDFSRFSPDELAVATRLDADRIPRHIAIIMDGNGRWAVARGLPRVMGHSAGVEGVRASVEACRALGVEVLTLYSFSTENWGRSDEEVGALMGLIEGQLREEVALLHTQNVRVRQLGRQQGLPASLCAAFADAETLTAANTRMTLQLAVNYSGRAELLDAARALAAQAAAGTLDAATLTEDAFAAALYRPDTPDPDLLVRTANERRISNYLLWQTAYAELCFTPVLWPDFRGIHLLDAVEDYQQRTRKFGRLTA
jgi:undecaprenyl diphosphate synthase